VLGVTWFLKFASIDLVFLPVLLTEEISIWIGPMNRLTCDFGPAPTNFIIKNFIILQKNPIKDTSVSPKYYERPENACL
jgi:hypothetical protein